MTKYRCTNCKDPCEVNVTGGIMVCQSLCVNSGVISEGDFKEVES